MTIQDVAGPAGAAVSGRGLRAVLSDWSGAATLSINHQPELPV